MQYDPKLCNMIPYYAILSHIIVHVIVHIIPSTFTRVSQCQDMLIQKFLAGIANMAAFSREVKIGDFRGLGGWSYRWHPIGMTDE